MPYWAAAAHWRRFHGTPPPGNLDPKVDGWIEPLVDHDSLKLFLCSSVYSLASVRVRSNAAERQVV
ncbi:hypothetical protein BV25DRAFT_1037858 [Artomyces pyxidatus]|uniref:Uncharacterized protein n=1 Tax=Artomyces pyxidatus TaxID=48021 RepID=A0ACB8SUF2_9AGAM|nr:hypothetical protein BV25DRAFT_1037858 [Artomyces pyxidatus]